MERQIQPDWNKVAQKLTSGLTWKIWICLLIGGLWAQPVAAHPHSWIDMKADMILDERGRLIAIRQHWSFDTYFSMVTLADVINEHGDKQTGLVKMADQMIGNLTRYRYFSVLAIDGSEIELPRPSWYQLTENTRQDQPMLELEMLFDITRPVVIRDKNLTWSVFDPTYYIAMNYWKAENVSIQGETGARCQLNLDSPNPSFELIEYAQSLDRTRKDTDGLGINFAEKVRIVCPSDAT